MKKQLLAGAFVLASFLTAQAQTQTFDFNDLTAGDLGVDITGEAYGQDNWITVANNGASPSTTTNMVDNSVSQVVAGDAAHGNVLSLVGPNGSGGYNLAVQLPGEFFDGREEGNDVFTFSYDFYTGSIETVSKNSFSVAAYGGNGGQSDPVYVLGGYAVDLTTLEVYGRGYLDAAGTQAAGSYLLYLEDSENGTTYTLPENTWVTLSWSYDAATGINEYKATANSQTLFTSTVDYTSALAAGWLPFEVDVFSTNLYANNTASATREFDNFNFTASTEGVLANKPIAALANLSVYPNPVNDVVNVSVDALVSNVAIVDLNGRTVKTAKFDGVANASVNVSDLASGIYMMTITSDKGATTKKIVKN